MRRGAPPHHNRYIEIIKESGQLLPRRNLHRNNTSAKPPYPTVEQFVGAFKNCEPEPTGTDIEGHDSFLFVRWRHDVAFSAEEKPSRPLSQRSLWAVRTDTSPCVASARNFAPGAVGKVRS